MHNRAHFPGSWIALVSIVLAVITLIGCQESKTAAPESARSASPGVTEQVFVVFEGPWAMVDDPKDATHVLAIAPKTKIHNDLYVAASNDSSLASGSYDLSVPAHGAAASGALDPTFAQAKIDAKSLQHALDDKSGRYIIRLPKPEAYVAARRFVSRVGDTYPPDAATEQNYATFVSFRYSVANLNGFSLAGTPDTGTFNPLLLQLDTPTIRFAIEPASPDDLADKCHTHSRSAFRDAVKFLGVKLYVDFPNDPASCHKLDPQTPKTASAGTMASSSTERAFGFLQENVMEVRWANAASLIPDYLTSLTRTKLARGMDLMAALYFWHMTGGSCKAPILFLTTTA